MPQALALSRDDLRPLRYDVHVLFANVQQGLSDVLPHKSRLLAELPRLDLAAIETLQTLAEALLWAHDDVTRQTQSAKQAEQDNLVAELNRLREMLLLQAEVFVLCGLLPESEVSAIRAGRGLTDTANDGIRLAQLFISFDEPLADKHPITPQQIARALELGQKLLQVADTLKPREELQLAVDLRDRFFTLLLLRHGELRKAGFYLFGEEAETRVPPLGARAKKAQSTPSSATLPPV